MTTGLSIALIVILSLLTLSLYKNNNLRAKANETKDRELLKKLYHQAATDLLHAIATIEPGPDKT